MQERLTDIIDVNGCIVRGDYGVELAHLREVDGAVEVIRTPECSLGMYFNILSYLIDLGFDVV